MLELQHVVKSYGDKTALKDFSLKLDNGLFGLLGENGAGKSTLIKILEKRSVIWGGITGH